MVHSIQDIPHRVWCTLYKIYQTEYGELYTRYTTQSMVNSIQDIPHRVRCSLYKIYHREYGALYTRYTTESMVHSILDIAHDSDTMYCIFGHIKKFTIYHIMCTKCYIGMSFNNNN